MKKTKVIIGLGLALCAAAALGACAAAGEGDDLIRKGYNVVVSYELNGGVFGAGSSSAGSSGGAEEDEIPAAFSIVHYYKGSELSGGVALLEPGSKEFEVGGTNLSTVARGGYFQIGWYRSMEPRVNEKNEPLDENGELCSETGKPQGHVFSGKWDFGEDRLTEADFPAGPDEKNAYRFTLYAAWSPNYIYEFYREKTDGELAAEKQKYEADQQKQIADGTLKPEDAKPFVEEKWLMYGSINRPNDGSPVAIPALDPETGAWEYGVVPQYAGHTIEKIYSDSALAEEYTSPIAHGGQVDEEIGTAENMIVRCYTTWRDGVWYEIRTAEQFYDNFDAAGCYVIKSDLDFTGVRWNGSNKTFTGKIVGNGYTISNLVGEQREETNAPLHAGGVFGVISAEASITDVHFENLAFNLYYCDYLRATSGATYGLFAGSIEEEATVENVTVTGTLNLGMLTNRFDMNGSYFGNFAVGLVSGDAVNKEISSDGCSVGYLEVDVIIRNEDGSTRQAKGYPVKATSVGQDGILTIALNEDKTQKPE